MYVVDRKGNRHFIRFGDKHISLCWCISELGRGHVLIIDETSARDCGFDIDEFLKEGSKTSDIPASVKHTVLSFSEIEDVSEFTDSLHELIAMLEEEKGDSTC